MRFDFVEIFSLIVVALELVFALFLLTGRNRSRLSNRLLAGYLFVDVMDVSGRFYSGLYDWRPAFGLLLNELVFLKLPMLHLYVLSAIYSGFELRHRHLWHAISYVVVSLLFIPEFFILPVEQQIEVVQSGAFNDFRARYLSYLMIHVQIVFYFVLIFRNIFHYKKLLQENYSNYRVMNYRWLFQLVWMLAIVAALATVKNFVLFFSSSTIFQYAQWVTALAALASVAVIVIKALHTSELFTSVDPALKSAKELVSLQSRESTTIAKVADDKNAVRLESIRQYILLHKPYLNADLTLVGLASQLKVNARELSILINHTLNLHFFDFINQFRIDEAKKLLLDKTKGLTIQQVLYEVGFNSKSSFNTAFKKYTGTTPTEFKKVRGIQP